MKILRNLLFVVNFVLLGISLLFAMLSGMTADAPSSNYLLDMSVMFFSWIYFLIIGGSIIYAFKKIKELKFSIKVLCIPIIYSVIHIILMIVFNNLSLKQKTVDENNATQCHNKGVHVVCGKDGKSYTNECFAKNIGIEYEGSCK